MSSNEIGARAPCQHVIEWRVNQPDCSERERRRLEAIREEGITTESQADLLAGACRDSGMRDVCEHAED
ncbi:hypothetical protein EA462_10205 [Natrarchaeobius halalkaliphilus]|uniref:Uncharacterized protein n=1 Tax=Natrarchaeobius halalkaliphilus TaxID=1679091 RepID=A0A3N6LQ31_9EURY|nr:hypothetical protein [Natrarchaeobius halalkaliphilus]RQG90337.1 hypothetical protein EA462_10205 [Natrarchaeobius halalkaliphilus]